MLLVFTLIARGTSGATLARVQLASPVRSEIVEAISGSATVSATDAIEITVPEGLTIAEMIAGTGQNIEPGDTIAIFQMDDVEEARIRETSNLDRMNLDLERLERGESIDASALENAQRSLSRAREDYADAIRQGEEDIADAQRTLDSLLQNGEHQEGTPSAIRSYARALEDFNATLQQGQEDVAAARQALHDILSGDGIDDTALQNAIRNHERMLEDFYSVVEQGEADVAAAQDALNELQRRRPADQDRAALDTAQRNMQRARDDYNSAIIQGVESISAAQTAINAAVVALNNASVEYPPNPASIAAAQTEVDRTQNVLTTAENTAESSRLTAARRVEDAEASLAQAQRTFDDGAHGEVERAQDALEAAQSRATDNLLAATRRREDAEVSLAQAHRNVQAEIERAQTALETAESRAEDNLQAATRRLEDATLSVDSEVERAHTALQAAISRAEDTRQSAARRVEDAAASLSTAEQTHQRSLNQNTDSAAQNHIAATTLRLDIAQQQSVVSTLDELIYSQGVLYADVSGTVSLAMPQGGVTGRTPIITLSDTSGGFQAQMQLAQTDAQHLTVGNDAEVTTGTGSIFFTPTTTGTVSSISSPDENDRVAVTIALPERNWNVGQRVDAQVVLNRANYDMSVPASAINSDNSGYFLHVMEQRNTVLGVQNIVERVNITIVAADDEMVAVMGAVTRDSRVITGSNRGVSAGDRVRVSE